MEPGAHAHASEGVPHSFIERGAYEEGFGSPSIGGGETEVSPGVPDKEDPEGDVPVVSGPSGAPI